MRHLTLGYLTIGKASPQDIIEAAAYAGFDSTGLRIVGRKAGDDFPQIVGNDKTIAQLRDALRERGLRLSNVTGNYLMKDAQEEDMRGLVRTGAQLGADYIAVTGHDEDHGRLTQNLAIICASASEFGLRVALEFVPYSSVRNLAEALAVVKGTGFSNAGIRIDALHFARSGGVPGDLNAADPALLFYFQICDAPLKAPATLDERIAESRAGRLYPGEGELPLSQYLDALAPGIEIEVETPHPAVAGVSWREQAARAKRALDRYLLARAAAR